MGGVSFSELVTPLGVDAFIQHLRDKTFVHVEHADRERFEYLFPWPLINSVLAVNLLDQKRLRIARDGRDVPPVLYRRDTERNPVDLEKAASLLQQNSSLVINRVQDLSPGVRRLARQIEAHIQHEINVNGYLSFGSGGAFAMHYDAHDVFVLQIYGEKHWFLYDEPEILPTKEEKAKAAKPHPRNVASDFILKAGEILFVPRGVYHRAEVTDQVSVHLTFGIHTLKGVDVVKAIRDQIMDFEPFRTDLDVLGGPEALARQEAALKATLCELVNGFSIADFVAKDRRERLPHEHISLGPAAALTDKSRVGLIIRHTGPYAFKGGAAKGSKAATDLAHSIISHLWTIESASVADLRLATAGENADLLAAVDTLIHDGFVEIIEP